MHANYAQHILFRVLSLGAIEDNLDHQPEADEDNLEGNRGSVMEKKCLLATIFFEGRLQLTAVHDGFWVARLLGEGLHEK